MKAFQRYRILVGSCVGIAVLGLGFLFILLFSYTQTQSLAYVSQAHSLSFHDPSSLPRLTSVSGVTLHVRGHIDGSASVRAENWAPQPISGDVDWTVYHDFFESSIAIEYLPSTVTSGHLTFDLTFE